MLKVQDLNVHYSGIQALKGIDLSVGQGKTIALVGDNGAGKSTVLKSLLNLVPKTSGAVTFDGMDITGLETSAIIKSGLTYAPEGGKVFPTLSVEENIRLGAYVRKDKAEVEADRKWISRIFPRLEERKWQAAGTLSGRERQMLSIARSLMSGPKLLMMDEPTLGLDSIAAKVILDVIKEIKDKGVSILLVGQDSKEICGICDGVYTLDAGQVCSSKLKNDFMENDFVENE